MWIPEPVRLRGFFNKKSGIFDFSKAMLEVFSTIAFFVIVDACRTRGCITITFVNGCFFDNMRITVLGIGNLLLKDEGFGIHVIRHLENRTSFPAGVKLVDGGTAGLYMASVLEECDRLIVVDVLGFDCLPGTICTLNGEELQGGNVQLRMSPHQLGFFEIMSICKLRGRSPDLVEFIGIVPFDLNVGTELSDLLASKIEVVAVMLENRLKEWLNA